MAIAVSLDFNRMEGNVVTPEQIAEQEAMNKVARGIDSTLNEGKVDVEKRGFFVAAFSRQIGTHPMTYISNVPLQFALQMLEQLLVQLKAELVNDAGSAGQGNN